MGNSKNSTNSNTTGNRTQTDRDELKAELRRLGLRAKKGLGQHFLVNGEVLSDIIEVAGLSSDDAVLEIGPGVGILTEALAQRARSVVAVELDEQLVGALKKKFATVPNVTIVEGDILRMAPESLMGGAGGAGYKVVANLPYYITSPILRHFLEAGRRPSRMVFMVQKEVAETIAAPRGEMSLLSVSVQFYAVPSIVRYVPAADFYPPPKVDSAIVKIEVLEKPVVNVDNVDSFFQVVAAGFRNRRKQIHNALARYFKLEMAEVTACLEQVGIDRMRRAQTLSLEEWGRLYEVLNDKGCLLEKKQERKEKKGERRKKREDVE